MHSLSPNWFRSVVLRATRFEEAPSIGANQGDRFKRRGGAKVRSTAIQNASMNAFFVRMYTALHLAEEGDQTLAFPRLLPPLFENRTRTTFSPYIVSLAGYFEIIRAEARAFYFFPSFPSPSALANFRPFPSSLPFLPFLYFSSSSVFLTPFRSISDFPEELE